MRERKKAQRRSEIMTHAQRLFDEKGYAAVSFDDIARFADVSVGTVYNYFPTKPELLFSLFEAEAFDLSLEIDRGQAYPSLQDEIVGIFEQAYAAIAHIEPALWRHLVAEMLLAPETFVKRWLVVEDQLSARIGAAITRRHGDRVSVGPDETMSAEHVGRAFYAIGKAGFYAYIGISHEDREGALATMFAQIRLLASNLFPHPNGSGGR